MECYWQGKADVLRRNPLQLKATNFTRSGLKSKPVSRGKRPKTNRLDELTNNTSNETVKPSRCADDSVFI